MTTSTPDPVAERIGDMLARHDIVLFMKGVPAAPQCGFSQTVVQIMGQLGVSYATFNVLADDEVREGIKAYSSWPTIPQLYVKGEFIGGCDIVREMYASGELQQLIADQGLG
ncbi:MAG: Grx4 family monothiol glutaredoxin [Rhodocyclaceae bacterium]|jgi:monothiol glutaredoxin|nr:Grx4 family monothiol glutaredoxin [Rhodocyclaceae bacterium]